MSGSYKKKKITNMATGIGASIVIVGAMFKIMHWPGASFMLVFGLSTEAALFLMGAFEEPHMDVDWSLVYPELAVSHDGSESSPKEHKKAVSSGDPVSQKLDSMLAEANIGTELIESLGSGLKKFGQTAENLNNVGSASAATEEFVQSIKGASSNVEKLSDSYSKAAASLTDLVKIEGQSISYGEQLAKMALNLAELNSAYEQQIQANNDSTRLTADITKNISELMLTLNDSVEDTKRYKQEVATLGENLSKLNTVYGNMLSAMNLGPKA